MTRQERRIFTTRSCSSGCCASHANDARERRGNGVEAGNHEQIDDVEDVLPGQAVAVDLRLEEPGDQIVARVVECLTTIELGIQVRVHPLRLLFPVRDRSFGRGATRADGGLLELLEESEVALGQAEDAEKHPRRQRIAERTEELDLTIVDERVDELIRQRAHHWLEGCDPLRREEWIEQTAVLRVLRPVDVQRDQRSMRPHGLATAPDLVLLQRRGDVGHLGQEHHAVVAPKRRRSSELPRTAAAGLRLERAEVERRVTQVGALGHRPAPRRPIRRRKYAVRNVA